MGEVFHIGSGTGSPSFQSSQWAANRALGLNCMRVGVNSDGATLPLNTLLTRIDTAVAASRNNRMYMMLGYFAAVPGAFKDNTPGNRDKWLTFWNAAAPRYANETHVLYELVNEPERWGQVGNYAASPTQPTALMIALRAVFNAMRTGAPNTISLAPSCANIDAGGGMVQYIRAIQAWESLGAVDWTKTLWTYHGYNQTHRMQVNSKFGTDAITLAPDAGRAALTWLKERYPIVCTETNWWMEAARKNLIDILDVHEELQIGWALLRRAGQTTPDGSQHNQGPWPLAPLFLENKIAQLRARSFNIPVE